MQSFGPYMLLYVRKRIAHHIKRKIRTAHTHTAAAYRRYSKYAMNILVEFIANVRCRLCVSMVRNTYDLWLNYAWHVTIAYSALCAVPYVLLYIYLSLCLTYRIIFTMPFVSISTCAILLLFISFIYFSVLPVCRLVDKRSAGYETYTPMKHTHKMYVNFIVFLIYP